MKKYCFGLLLILVTWNVQAHQPDLSSTMLVEQGNNTWVLQIRSALSAFDQTIQANYPKYESAEEFQALVLQHIQDNLQITFNDQVDATLQNGAIKLGHETSVVFEVIGVPENIESVYVKNSSFKSINRNQSALILLKKGFKKKQFTLSKKNDYALHLKVANAEFTPVDPTVMPSTLSTNHTHIYTGIGLSLIAMLISVFIIVSLWKRRNGQQLT